MSRLPISKAALCIETMKCEWQSLQPQANHFLLLNGRLNADEVLPVGTSCTVEKQPFKLFRQQDRQVSFLSLMPVTASLELTLLGETDLSPIQVQKDQAWQISPEDHFQREVPLLIHATHLTLPAAMDLAHRLMSTHTLRVLLESNHGFPFAIQPARFLWPNFPPEAMGASRLLEDWDIPNRLLSTDFMPGCYQGTWSELLSEWTLPQDWQQCHLR